MAYISVIMPVYNKARYLKKSISSIINQTFNDFELIIIDDGSIDNSLEICEEFAKHDNRIKIVKIKNSGVSAARNIGLQNCTGKYIQFIDSDDYIDLQMFEELNNIINNYNPEIILSGITKVDKNYKKIKEIIPRLKGLNNKTDIMNNFVGEQFSTGLYGCVSNKLIKRSIIEDINLRFNENIKLAEDLDFYLTLYDSIRNIFFCNKSYYYYLQNTENSSTSLGVKNDYFTQIMVVLKAKNMLIRNNTLCKKDEVVINSIITNFIICYLYDEINISFKRSKVVIGKLVCNDEIMMSLIINSTSTFKKSIIYLTKNKNQYLVWFLLVSRKLCEVVYRRVRYGFFNRKV